MKFTLDFDINESGTISFTREELSLTSDLLSATQNGEEKAWNAMQKAPNDRIRLIIAQQAGKALARAMSNDLISLHLLAKLSNDVFLKHLNLDFDTIRNKIESTDEEDLRLIADSREEFIGVVFVNSLLKSLY